MRVRLWRTKRKRPDTRRWTGLVVILVQVNVGLDGHPVSVDYCLLRNHVQLDIELKTLPRIYTVALYSPHAAESDTWRPVVVVYFDLVAVGAGDHWGMWLVVCGTDVGTLAVGDFELGESIARKLIVDDFEAERGINSASVGPRPAHGNRRWSCGNVEMQLQTVPGCVCAYVQNGHFQVLCRVEIVISVGNYHRIGIQTRPATNIKLIWIVAEIWINAAETAIEDIPVIGPCQHSSPHQYVCCPSKAAHRTAQVVSPAAMEYFQFDAVGVQSLVEDDFTKFANEKCSARRSAGGRMQSIDHSLHYAAATDSVVTIVRVGHSYL